jgi:nucleotide-binding universal stress UspA family protein
MSKKSSASKRPILVAIDFSEHSAGALLWAADAAECFDAPVLLLHVVHDPESSPGYYLNAKRRKKLLRRIEEAAEEMMAEFVRETLKKHPTVKKIKELEALLVIGLPVTRILEIAKKREARLIVVGSQGRTGLPHLLLGSKALKVAQLSPIPVTIVKDGAAGSEHQASEAEKESNA